ncbi:MAG: ureidoglycolate lyase [Xanthomonadales bacterium]|nr:ureidoglycolate lyase [Xanthomonadales bacterium]
MKPLMIEPLTAHAFSPFGDVIAPRESVAKHAVNAGTAVRFHALGTVDVVGDDARALISIFRAQPRSLPFEVTMLERHPLGSQAFVPMEPQQRYIVLVAESPEDQPRAFLAANGQGVNYRRGCWHYPLIALDRESNFLVVDRGGSGVNCEEATLGERYRLESF